MPAKSNNIENSGRFKKGHTFSEEWLLENSKRMIKWHKNNKHPMLDKKHSKETIDKMSKAMSGKNHPRWIGRKNVNCKNCNKPFEILITKNTKYCSRACYYNEHYNHDLVGYEKYKCHVLRETERQDIKALKNFNKRGTAGVVDNYHLDHKYSICDGYKNNIYPEIIGNIKNLKFIPWEENLHKNKKSSILVEEIL